MLGVGGQRKSLSRAERLRSRFDWGLMADIQQPDFETRLVIFRFNSERVNRFIDPTLLEVIA